MYIWLHRKNLTFPIASFCVGYLHWKTQMQNLNRVNLAFSSKKAMGNDDFFGKVFLIF